MGHFRLDRYDLPLTYIIGSWGPPFLPHKAGVPKWEERTTRESAYFLAVNRNKKSVTLNLKTSEGIDIARKLAAKADILIENVCVTPLSLKSPTSLICDQQIAGKLEKLGLGYDAVRNLKEDIIYCSVTGESACSQHLI